MAAARNLFEEALAAEGVTGQLAKVARSIHMQESGGGKNTTTSNAGAVGGMQIIPSTFKSVADKDWDIKDPLHNARAGIRYIKQLDKQAGGDPVLTAAGYYGGPGGLEKARRGVAVADPRNPNAPTTLQYGQQVAARAGLAGSDAPAPGRPATVVAQAPVTKQPMVLPSYGAAPLSANLVAQSQEATPVVAQTPVDPIVNAPAPVVAQAPIVPAGPDPWLEFNQKFQQPEQITAQDLNYASAYQAPKLVVPDFMSMVGYANPEQRSQRQSSFTGFNDAGFTGLEAYS